MRIGNGRQIPSSAHSVLLYCPLLERLWRLCQIDSIDDCHTLDIFPHSPAAAASVTQLGLS
jgi:hypothetical protein